MKVPDTIDINEYSYPLPEDRIAKYPLENREGSKLLYYNGGKISTHRFNDLPGILNNEYHLVINDTKVIRARLKFKKATGAEIEIFLLQPWSPSNYTSALAETKESIWRCLVGNAKKWKSGVLQKKVKYQEEYLILKAERSENGEDNLILFKWNKPNISFSQVISAMGITPIPPYIHRDVDENDNIRYQTVYSQFEGSVAAPTAGLHFTDEVFEKLKNKGIRNTLLTLHVGAGTFIPVKENDAVLHNMHTEHFYVSRKSLEELWKSEGMLVAVGTTSVRTLESLYWIGVKLSSEINKKTEIHLDQWEMYDMKKSIPRGKALEVILNYLRKHDLNQLEASTRIMIVPGYDFMMTDAIITNFHQPKSTLLLLISAYLGDDWKSVYKYALENEFRFLSYGDSSLLIR